jgi:membrane-associated phospholipid phosphatase
MAGFVAAAAALVLFAWLGSQVLAHQEVRFDAAVRAEVRGWASPLLTRFMRSVTWLGAELVLIPLGALAVWRLSARGRRRAALLLVSAAAGGEVLDQALKMTFRRVRPESFFDIHPLGYSFPSGHAVVSCCFYGMMAAIITRRMAGTAARIAVWAAAALLILLIGLSRIYLGVHHASDVVAGYAAGVIWLASVATGHEWRMRRRPPATADSRK